MWTETEYYGMLFLFLSESNPVFHTHYLYKYITGTTVHIWKENNKLPNDYDSMEKK